MRTATAETGAEGAIVSTAAEMRAELIEAQSDRAALAEILAITETQAHNAAVRAWPGDLLVYSGAMQRGLGNEQAVAA